MDIAGERCGNECSARSSGWCDIGNAIGVDRDDDALLQNFYLTMTYSAAYYFIATPRPPLARRLSALSLLRGAILLHEPCFNFVNDEI